MTTEPTETVDQLILPGLDDAPLPAAAIDLIYAALLGPDELASALGGTAPARPVPSARATDRATVAWQRWRGAVDAEDAGALIGAFDDMAAALRPIQAAARAVIAEHRQAWRPIADKIREYVRAEQAGRQAAWNYQALQKAITWLRHIGGEIRNRKLEPVAQAATEIWNTLRQESSVALGAIRLAGSPTRT